MIDLNDCRLVFNNDESGKTEDLNLSLKFLTYINRFPPTKYIQHIPRVPQCLSPRWNCPPPTPSPPASVPPHPNQTGGLTRLRARGWGCSNSDDWRKSLALCLLCFPFHKHSCAGIPAIQYSMDSTSLPSSYLCPFDS
jgi:hypothetical protein